MEPQRNRNPYDAATSLVYLIQGISRSNARTRFMIKWAAKNSIVAKEQSRSCKLQHPNSSDFLHDAIQSSTEMEKNFTHDERWHQLTILLI